MLQTPAPAIWNEQHSFAFVFDSILRIDLSGFIAYFFASILNVVLITKWKWMVRGKYFWLRSIGSSTIAEGCYSAIAIFIIGFGSLSVSTNYIKLAFKIDVYDKVSYNPFVLNTA